ncbi:hypothetical protein [Calothrix sp. NIES-2098]|uniref:hypothetical protein n=1 Tax=Calothrix sp. NIES-2098 TaxID=1954171 RepID=UPI000B5E7A4C|nr:hypothetical protein NIES2098_61290 [Calothrix sp. NIES-2098]
MGSIGDYESVLADRCLACDVFAGKVKALGGAIYEDNYWIVEHSLVLVLVLGYLIIKLGS